ncbi:MAG: 23S rRNA (pseudouridine(1915)-N(3))-methyltransferase RlmH [Coprococcus sp.]
MEINIYLNIKKPDSAITSAINEYIKRLSPYCRLNLLCSKKMPSFSLNKNTYNASVVPASSKSPTLSSDEYSAMLSSMMTNRISKINYYIGYEKECTDKAEYFSISSFSLSEQLTATALSEQIYRAYTIMNNITYHK